MMLKHSIKQCNITWRVHQYQHRIILLKLVYRRTQLLSCFLNICWSFNINVRRMSVFRDKNRWKYLHSCRHFATTQRHSETRDNSCAFRQRWGKSGSQFSRKTSLDIEKGCVLYMIECAYTFDYFEIRAVMAVFVWKLDLQLPIQSVPITTDVVSSNLDQGEVYNIMW